MATSTISVTLDETQTLPDADDGGTPTALVQACVCQRFATCPHRFYFNQVTCQFADGTLTLHGQVPTFYLKQILQTMLLDIEHVKRISNEVRVVNSVGLSSE